MAALSAPGVTLHARAAPADPLVHFDEAFTEVDGRRRQEPDLVVENRLLLKYRSNFIFYVASGHEALAATIESALVQAYRNGTYMKLFNSHRYIQDALTRGKLASRLTFTLDNPFLSDADRRIPDEYWMS